jgi:hypothetical protein
MAITKQQTTTKFRVTNSSPATGTFVSPPVEGELITVAFWGWSQPRWMPQDVTDNQGNSYSLAAVAQNNSGSSHTAIWWAVSGPVTGSFIITINPEEKGNFYGAGCATSWSSTLGNTWRPDARARATGSSTTPAPGTTGTLDVADQVVIAAFSITTTQASITVGVVSPVLTEDAEELSFATYVPGEANSRIVAATTAQSPSWTCASSGQWAAVVCTFAETTST